MRGAERGSSRPYARLSTARAPESLGSARMEGFGGAEGRQRGRTGVG